MRRFIIDTDTGSDDAVALVMALRDKDIKVEAITTVAGNVDVDQATINAMISIEMADTYQPPVYKGMNRPIMHKYDRIAVDAHGDDGMGNMPLPAPKMTFEKEHAVDALIRLIEDNPGELELCTIGPLTNIAMMCLLSPGTINKLKKITIMGGCGIRYGNASPVAEGNIHMDAEAMEIVLQHVEIPTVFSGWDLCIDEAFVTEDEIKEYLATGSKLANFCIHINDCLINLNVKRFGRAVIDPADQVAWALAAHPEFILESFDVYCYVEYKNDLTYGQILMDRLGQKGKKANGTIVTKIDVQAFKKYMFDTTV